MSGNFFKDVQTMAFRLKKADRGELSSTFCIIVDILLKSNEIWKNKDPSRSKRLASGIYNISEYSRSCSEIIDDHKYSIGPTDDEPIKDLSGILLPPLDHNDEFFIIMGVKFNQGINNYSVHLHVFHQDESEPTRIIRFRFEKHEKTIHGEENAHKYCHVHVDMINGITQKLSRGSPRIPVEVDEPCEMILVALSSFYDNDTISSIVPGCTEKWDLRFLKVM